MIGLYLFLFILLLCRRDFEGHRGEVAEGEVVGAAGAGEAEGDGEGGGEGAVVFAGGEAEGPAAAFGEDALTECAEGQADRAGGAASRGGAGKAEVGGGEGQRAARLTAVREGQGDLDVARVFVGMARVGLQRRIGDD